MLGRFALVPLAVGDASAAEVAQAIERLWGGDETLVVVSTDLSHFLPDARARALDASTMDRVLRFDERIGHDEACGATPLAGALRVARTHGLEPRLLDLRHSGDAGGDPDRVVGYGAAAFRPAANARLAAGAGAAEAARAGPSGPRLDDPRLDDARLDDPLLGRALLGRARNAIAAALGLAQRVPEPWHDALARPGATFVTLRHEAALRGCVGRIEPGPHALDEDVRRNARSAAFDDPRFEPLAAHAFDGLEIEVSLLGAVEPVPAASQAEAVRRLRPGEDGVVLDWRGRRSTFLPQVWAELPDAHAFLAALKRKAGLPGGAWFPDLALGRYSVVKFTDAGGRP